MTDFMDLFREELRTWLHSDESTESFIARLKKIKSEICEDSDKEVE